jgi:D-hydroxyproline dehydrogenase subunit gamma
MPDAVTILVDGRPLRAPRGTTVAAALLNAGITTFRRSVSGEPRAPLCGMGVCFECRLAINGVEHCRACQTLCEDGMEVRTA